MSTEQSLAGVTAKGSLLQCQRQTLPVLDSEGPRDTVGLHHGCHVLSKLGSSVATPLMFTFMGAYMLDTECVRGGGGESLRSKMGCAIGAEDTGGLSVEDK